MRILIAFALALTLAAPEAAAERIRVKGFSGSKRMAKKIRRYVVKIVKRGDNRLVRDDYDGLIRGKVKRRGRKYKVYLRLYDRDDKVTKKFAFGISRRGMSKRQRILLRKKLLRSIGRLPEPEPIDDEFEDEEFADDEFVDDEFAESEEPESDDEDAGVSKSASGESATRGPKGHVHAGMSVIRRSFTFGGEVGNYNGAPAGGASVDALVFPFAYDKKAKGWKPKVGVGLAYERSVGLKSRFEGGGEELPTTQSRFAIDARYRLRFGKEARATTVMGSVGIEKLSFAIDRTNAPDGVTIMVPNTAYTSLTPGAELYYPVNDKVAVLASAHLKVIVGAGEIVDQSQYGTGSGFGYDVSGGAEYMLTETVSLRGGLQYDKVSLSFDSEGDLSNMGEFSKSADTYFGGFVTAGFKL